MNLKQLIYFNQIYHSQNLTQASRELFISQQGLSRSLQELENELEVSLFVRQHNHLQPTAAADFLIARSVPLVQKFQDLKRATMERFANRRELKIAVAPGILRSLSIPQLLAFENQMPQTTLEILHADDFDCENKVRSGEVEAALTVNSTKIHGLHKQKIASENYYILTGPQYVWPDSAVRLADLAEAEFVCFDEHYRLQGNFIAMCQAAGFQPKIIFTSNETTTLAKFAIASNSLFLCVEHIIAELNLPEMVIRPLETTEKWEIVSLTKETNLAQPTTTRFIDFLLTQF